MYFFLFADFASKSFPLSFDWTIVGQQHIHTYMHTPKTKKLGDFVQKGRTIQNPTEWVPTVCNLLRDFVSQQTLPYPPLLYIATDTPSMITLFRKELDHPNNNSIRIPVLDLPQKGRRNEGQGVLFGEAIKVSNKGLNQTEDESDDSRSCLQAWTDTLMDMFLLSHADVVIAGKPSSFSQTLPMSIALGRQDRRKVKQTYCEVIPRFANITVHQSTVWQELSPTLECFEDYIEWCCNHSTWIKFNYKGPGGHPRVMSKEFVQFLNPAMMAKKKKTKDYPFKYRDQDCLRPKRGRIYGGLKDKCLPHEW